MTGTEDKFLAIYHDDSSLMIALGVAQDVEPYGKKFDFMKLEAGPADRATITPDQEKRILKGRPITHRVSRDRPFNRDILKQYSAVFSAKYVRSYRRRKRFGCLGFGADRPCFVSVWSGIEFFPEQGFKNRGYSDVIAFNNRIDRDAFERLHGHKRPAEQQRVVYHPSFVARPRPGPDANQIVFFTQAITPHNELVREKIVRTLAEIAKAHPELDVVVKMRSKRNENQNHTHREVHSYDEIIEELGLCDLLRTSFEPAVEVLDRTRYAITCSSTAGIEALARGIPTAFLMWDASEADDPLAFRAMQMFADSGLLRRIESLQELDFSIGTPEWRNEFIAEGSSVESLLEAIDDFQKLPLSQGLRLFGTRSKMLERTASWFIGAR